MVTIRVKGNYDWICSAITGCVGCPFENHDSYDCHEKIAELGRTEGVTIIYEPEDTDAIFRPDAS